MFYLICFGILFVLAVLNVQMHDKLSTQILSGLAAIMLIGIAGLRYETGGDWDAYTDIFANLESIDSGIEEGFMFLCQSIKSMGGTVQHLFFVVTLINITLIDTHKQQTGNLLVELIGFAVVDDVLTVVLDVCHIVGRNNPDILTVKQLLITFV